MKKKLNNILIIIGTILIFYLIIFRKMLVSSSISYSLNIWIKNLLPTLFPFFIISDILINYNIMAYIPSFFKKSCQAVFNITEGMLQILVLSMISGFPSNARNAKTMYLDGKLTVDEANHILIFSHFANPVFILTTIGIFFFNNQKLGIILLIVHYLSNFILGFIFRWSFKRDEINMTYKDEVGLDFGSVLVKSINKSVDTVLSICGIVTVFYLVSTLLGTLFNLNGINVAIFKGIFEITIGVEALSKLSIPLLYKAIVTSMFLAFGGLSVHLQVKSQLVDTPIDYHYFFIGRMYQAIIAGILTFMIMMFIY